MIKLFFLMIFLFMGSYSLKADEVLGSDREFMNELDAVKNPFEDGLPKLVPVVIQPTKPEVQPAIPMPMPKPPEPIAPPRPMFVMPEIKPAALPVTLPNLRLQGVIVGEDIHEAIINEQVVPLRGFIEGAQVDSVSKEGVGLLFKGKKVFLKVD
jgi:hypothetical protein